MRNLIRLILILSPLLLSACANFSAGNLFSHYSEQNQALYQAVKQGEYQQAEAALPDSIAGEILDNMEKGRVYFLNADYDQSQPYLQQSDQAVTAQQEQARISISDSAASLGALAANDNMNIYRPADYELGFLHLYLGLNYVLRNQLDDALVEMRRANQVQEKAHQDREEELESAASKIQDQGLSPNLGSLLSNYPDAGKMLQAVQNGYLFYLSALLYETAHNLNDAWIDYQRALAVAPDNREVIAGALRVGTQLGMSQEVARLEQRYGQDTELSKDRQLSKERKLPKGQARLLFIEEQGVVQAMQGWNLSLPIRDKRGNLNLYSVALPHYSPVDKAVQLARTLPPYQLNGSPVRTSLLNNVNNMAEQALSERIPSMILRQALRVWAKDRLRKEAEKQSEGIGGLIFNVWNALTEQPDTRSWLTLPSTVFSAHAYVPAGTQTLNVDGKTYSFQADAGQTVLVWMSRQGGHATIWHKSLGRWE